MALLLFGACGALSGIQARHQSESDAAQALQQLADRLAQRLDADMAQRYHEVMRLATLEGLLDIELGSERWRVMLERLQSSTKQFSWIGLADRDGVVRTATQSLLVGRNVQDRPWFSAGLARPIVGDVHEATLLASLLPADGDEPLRFVDVAAPLMRDGRAVGVIGAHLSWAWAEERRRALLSTVPADRGVEILLVDQAGARLLGPRQPTLVLASNETAHTLMSAAVSRRWSDRERYVTAASSSHAAGDYPGMGWAVVVRQSEASAFASANALQERLWLLGAAGALLFGVAGWWLAGRLTEPLRELAARARAQAPGGGAPAHDEVEQLARSIGVLIDDLHAREQALQMSNEGLEARVRERTASLQQANDDLRSFSRSVSHDLRGPLGAMATLLRQLLGRNTENLSADARRLLTLVATEAERLRELTEELLTLAMVEQRELTWAPVDSRRLVDEVLARVEAKDAPLAPEMRVGALPMVTADPVLLSQVWTNLLSNAIKFSSKVAAPCIEITAEETEGEVAFRVADNGAGFDARQAARLFGIFQRLHANSEFPGTGVGLSIVRRAVHRHGGRVWAESSPGSGARFYFTLPRGSGRGRQAEAGLSSTSASL